jgi:hypothetical protein
MTRKTAQRMPVIPKPVPFGTPGIRVIPKSAKEVTMKCEMNDDKGEKCGPIFFDGVKLEGRWFSVTEAKALSRLVGARYMGEL